MYPISDDITMEPSGDVGEICDFLTESGMTKAPCNESHKYICEAKQGESHNVYSNAQLYRLMVKGQK